MREHLRHLAIVVMAMMLLGGCRITKESIAQSTMTTAKQRTDSTKYAKVTDAFLNGEFVFKINRKGDKKVDPTDNNIVISNGMFHYQYVKYANMDLPGIFQGSGQPPIKIESGKIHEVKESYDAKKKIFTIHYRNAERGEMFRCHCLKTPTRHSDT